MLIRLFQPLREWGDVTRRSKGSKKPSGCVNLKRAKDFRSDGRRLGAAPSEINLCSEPPCGEFITEQRSPEASWLNIKQLTH